MIEAQADHPDGRDDLLGEVRRNRAALLHAAGGTLDGLYALLKDREAAESRPIARGPRRESDGRPRGEHGEDAGQHG